ncbi:magnesium chelatase family protein [Lachnospiraceae bacterium NE2001]|nr:magnesium chelatase family protein [Lachnospiraceae bacterium NE2001]
MYSKVNSGTTLGIDGMLISVETDLSQGLPGMSLVGYLASSVKEAGERVRSALKNSGIAIPSRRITVNLSPADLRKDGAGFDLAIAVGIIISLEIIPISESLYEDFQRTLFLGELSLDGRVLPASGVLPIVDHAVKQGINRVVIPMENAPEASIIRDVSIYPVSCVEDILSIIISDKWPTPFDSQEWNSSDAASCECDLADIRGQETMKRGVMIAVAGFHNILMTGAAGSGKSMIAKCIPGIMPPLSYEESMELTKIYSVAGLTSRDKSYITRRPFRSPGQNVSQVALLGGGASPRPGEVSLASGGVLFLDEFPEFPRAVIESLRQPMEDKKVRVARVKASYTFPARFMLVSARNNCPCGFFPDRKRCHCTASEINHYQNKISHPIMDRIDIRLEINPVSYADLFCANKGMSSSEARERIMIARARQERRFKDEDFVFNSEIPQGKMAQYIHIGDKEQKLIQERFERSDMSARGYYRVLKLVRTIADVEDRDNITEQDIEEAMFFRNENENTKWL